MKKFIGLTITLCILLCTLSVAANEPPHSNINWSIENGALKISGIGPMEDFRTEAEIPWYEQRNEITEIYVEEGITRIGNMAFYGLKKAQKAYVPESVESVGLCAFHYTEGTSTNLGNPSADFQFDLKTDSSVVSKDETFVLSIVLNGDFKDVNAVQTTLLYDRERFAIEEENWYDKEWYDGINDENLGYISKPMSGFVANNLRLGYLSMSGAYIDTDSPLYTKGKTDIVIAKVIVKALADVYDINPSCFALKDSAVSINKESGSVLSTSGENQLTNSKRLPLATLKIYSKSASVTAYAKENSIAIAETEKETDINLPKDIKVFAKGELVEFDTAPYFNDNGKLLIPLRAPLEKLGVSVMWEQDTSTVFMATFDDFAALQPGKKSLFKNSTSIELEEVIEVKNQRTMVSYDIFQKAFGFTAVWDDSLKTLTIE